MCSVVSPPCDWQARGWALGFKRGKVQKAKGLGEDPQTAAGQAAISVELTGSD